MLLLVVDAEDHYNLESGIKNSKRNSTTNVKSRLSKQSADKKTIT